MIGADYLVRPGLLIGLMAQMDWMNDSASNATAGDFARDGRGWMAGPYLSTRLTPGLFFDARALWGRSTNHVDPMGAYVDTFETTRALAAARLTGEWANGALRVRPSAEIIYFSETQDAYVNAIAIAIAGQTYTLGRVIAGPEFNYRLELADKSVLEPFLGLKAIWDFARPELTTAAGAPVGEEAIRGRVEAGIAWRTPAGISVGVRGAYDGIGSSGYQAVQGSGRVTVPLP